MQLLRCPVCELIKPEIAEDKGLSCMALSVLICDDSRLARNQLARSLPSEWKIDISFACNGQEAIEKIEQGAGELVFLDLNMPVMDGYETLAKIKERDLPAMVIVVSGDIQAQAKEKVMALGAMDLLKNQSTSHLVFSSAAIWNF